MAKKRKIGHHGKMAVAGSWSLADRIRKNTVNGIVVCTSQSKM